jgi:hypothetical protein
MDSDDDNNDNKNTVLEIIPSNQLRLIPLYGIITHIYEKIIEKAADCEFTYAFNIDQLIHNYGMNTKIGTPNNKMYIINEIKKLFPGIKITEIAEKYSAKSQHNSHWRACWEEDINDDAHSDCELLETSNGENDDDVMLNKAIQLSLNEAKPPERANTRIMGEKAEERIQKSRQKYKKLYN